jgi:hypothetical protein
MILPPLTRPMINLMKAAERLGICVGSAKSVALKGIPTSDSDFAGFAVARPGRDARLRCNPDRGAAGGQTAVPGSTKIINTISSSDCPDFVSGLGTA